MNRLTAAISLCILLLTLSANPSFAGRAKRGEKPPKALLVELMTRKNQLDYVRKHDPAKAVEMQKDIDAVMKATILDFSTNFDYLPVFFFVDTNADLIRNGKFDGVLLDEYMKPVKQTVLAEGDTNIFIGYYGGFMPQPEIVKTGSATQESSGTAPLAQGDDATALKRTFLVMDHNFSILRLPKPRTPKGYVKPSNSKDKALYYRSRHFEIDYVPLASAYDFTLYRYYRARREY